MPVLGQLGARRAPQRSTSVLERVTLNPAPPDLVLKFVNLLPPCMFLELFELLPLRWNLKQVILYL